MVDFEAGRYAAALALFERALLYPASSVDRATLLFNMGACFMALGRFEQAEEKFVESASANPSGGGTARIQAGFAALRAGRIPDAWRHLAAVRDARTQAESPGDDAAVTAAIARLGDAIAERESALARQARWTRCRELAARGATELVQLRHAEAQRTFESAIVLARDMDPLSRADLRHKAALAAYRRGDTLAARDHVEQAIADSPKDGQLRVLQARILVQLGDSRGASRAARRAAELGAVGDALDDLGTEVDAASPLPRSGWSGHLVALGGWDSSPSHSGVGDEPGVRLHSTDSGSATSRVSGAISLTGPSGEHAAARLEYTMDWVGLFAEEVEALSVQSHSFGPRWYRELGERWLLQLGGTGGVHLADLKLPELMTYGLRLDAAVTLDPAEELSTEVGVHATRTEAVGDYEYLAGTRLEARVQQRWRVAPVNVELGIGGKRVGLGVVAFTTSQDDLPACEADACERATYRVPLSYAGPVVDLAVAIQVMAPLSVRLGAESEYRQYLDASSLDAEPRSRKTRGDWRWQLRAGSELGLVSSKRLALVAQYAWTKNASNVDYDPSDPEHDLDYGCYSFSRHLALLGVSGTF